MNRFYGLYTPFAGLLLAGCAGLNPGNPKLQVQITDACEKGAETVPFPKMTDDAVLMIGRHRAALKTANTTIVNTRDCIKEVRERYARGG